MAGKVPGKSVVPELLSKEWVTKSDAAEQICRKPMFVSKLIAKKKLSSMRYGRFVFVSRSSIEAYLKSFEGSQS